MPWSSAWPMAKALEGEGVHGVDRDPLPIPAHPVQHPEVDIEFRKYGRVVVVHDGGRSIASLWHWCQLTGVLLVAIHLKKHVEVVNLQGTEGEKVRLQALRFKSAVESSSSVQLLSC